MKKDQTTYDVSINNEQNHEMDSIVEYDDQVSKSMSRPSRSQGSSNEDMSENSEVSSQVFETSPKVIALIRNNNELL